MKHFLFIVIIGISHVVAAQPLTTLPFLRSYRELMTEENRRQVVRQALQSVVQNPTWCNLYFHLNLIGEVEQFFHLYAWPHGVTKDEKHEYGFSIDQIQNYRERLTQRPRCQAYQRQFVFE